MNNVPTKYNEIDNAAMVMNEPYPGSWIQSRFITVVGKDGFVEVMYKAIKLYIDEQLEFLGYLLSVLSPKVEASRVNNILKRVVSAEV